MNLKSLAAKEIAGAGFQDLERAVRLLRGLAGQGVTDDEVEALLPNLLRHLAVSADPDRALMSFVRWSEAVTSRTTHFQFLSRHPLALSRFFQVCASSQLFADILIRQPEYIEILVNPGPKGNIRSAAAFHREVRLFVGCVKRPELKLEALRRVKQRELLRIGARDLLGLSDLATTAREFSHLADALVQQAVEIARTDFEERNGRIPGSFAVIAMGKHGGEELNYASDIDLLFVAPDDSEGSALTDSLKLGEFVTNALSRNMHNGHVFRIDMRLRPEGRFGPLARTLGSYREYYETWAEPWERQALIKARFIAGDPALGAAFKEMATPIVYRRWVTSDFLEAIRDNKRRIESRAAARGETETNVKVGRGGIRDIEFLVQLLQLKLGGRLPSLRTGNTLQALAALRHAGLLRQRQEEELSEDYAFLRTVEHRLQILYEQQTQSLPPPGEERRLLARRLGFEHEAAFQADLDRRRARVREHFEALFWNEEQPDNGCRQEWAEALGDLEGDPKSERVAQLLQRAGFHDPARGVQFLSMAYVGNAYGAATPEDRLRFSKLVGQMVASCARTGNPDRALQGIEALSMAAPNASAIYRMLAESEEMLDRLSSLAAYAPETFALLSRRQEWLDLLVSEEIVEREPKPTANLLGELEERGLLGVPGISGETFAQGLASFVQRERLRIAARDLWGEIGPSHAAAELSNLADAILDAILGQAIAEHTPTGGEPCRIAVIGMGKLGGRELGYRSDWDLQLVFQHEGRSGKSGYASANSIAERFLVLAQETRACGAPIEVDPRLRPEGRFGPLVSDVDEMTRYYRESAQTWERQALLKARFVAGDAPTGASYLSSIRQMLYAGPLSDEAAEEVRAMKRRIEQERLKPGERETDLKLGFGGLSDVEFLVQLRQWQFGHLSAAVRSPETCLVIRALAACGAIAAPDAALLERTFVLLSALRNRLALAGASRDSLPEDAAALRPLALSLAIADQGGMSAENRLFAEVVALRKDVRTLFIREFQHTLRPRSDAARTIP